MFCHFVSLGGANFLFLGWMKCNFYLTKQKQKKNRGDFNPFKCKHNSFYYLISIFFFVQNQLRKLLNLQHGLDSSSLSYITGRRQKTIMCSYPPIVIANSGLQILTISLFFFFLFCPFQLLIFIFPTTLPLLPFNVHHVACFSFGQSLSREVL